MSRIAELRKRQKLNQKQLGSIIGVAQNTISNWETGKREPDHESLKKMADFFGVSVDCLLGRDEKKPPTKIDEGQLDEQLIQRLRSLTAEEQSRVDAFVQGMIASR